MPPGTSNISHSRRNHSHCGETRGGFILIAISSHPKVRRPILPKALAFLSLLISGANWTHVSKLYAPR